MKTLVVGFDGAEPALIRRFVENHDLPAFESLIRDGCFGRLRTSLPPISGSAWNTFATGKNPGKHGVYDFVTRERDSYHDHVISSRTRDAVSFWDCVSQEGGTVGVLNVPGSYPPERLRGFMVAGMLSPGWDASFTHPDGLKREIRGEYRLSHEKLYAPGREGPFLEDLYDVADRRLRTALRLFDQKDPDLGTLVFGFTDTVQHFFWKHMEQGVEPYASTVLEAYRRADRFLGRLMDWIGPQGNVLVVSDHGFGPLGRMVQLNLWLMEQGFLTLKSGPMTQLRSLLSKLGWTAENVYRTMTKLGLQNLAARQSRETRNRLLGRLFFSWDDVDWSRTLAYARGHLGQIYLNRKQREPEGIVTEEEASRRLRELQEALSEWEDPRTGGGYVTDTFEGRRVFRGAHREKAPDLIVFFNDLETVAYPGLIGSNRKVSDHPKYFSGGHRMDGLIGGRGPDIVSGRDDVEADITDVAPTVLYLQGAPVPDGMDGEVLRRVLRDRRLDEQPVRTCAEDYYRSEETASRPEGPEDGDEEKVRDRLRNLGYLD